MQRSFGQKNLGKVNSCVFQRISLRIIADGVCLDVYIIGLIYALQQIDITIV